MYQFVETVAKLYGLLQDDLSKHLFWDRLKYEMNPCIDNTFQIIRTAVGDDRTNPTYWEDIFDTAVSKKMKIILYGPGEQGKGIGQQIIEKGKDFFAFCGRNFEKHPNGIMGKPVLSPLYLKEHSDECYVIISTMKFYGEVFEELKQIGFPMSRILLFTDTVGDIAEQYKKQYFEFPQFYKKDTAFVDAGCFDCSDSLKFAEWCAGRYSKIYAFEPDAVNFAKCETVAKKSGLRDIELLHAGTGKEMTSAFFVSQGDAGSHLSAQLTVAEEHANVEKIQITTLDDVIAPSIKVGFIKMDIEGAEYDALLGAKSVLLRDKPLLAICIYHKRGDMLAIMDLLHTLIPEYRFWIRHYSMSVNETVLYAAIPEEMS